MTAIKESLNLGDLLKYEAPQLYSREVVTVLAGEVLPLGAVLGQVTASGKLKALDPSATDGSEVAAGVLLEACEALTGDRPDGLIVTRHAFLADHALVWPLGITASQNQTAIQQLKALGLLVRHGA
jgi:hypothetical protein